MVLQSVPLRVRLLSSASLILLGASVSAALSVPAASQTIYPPVYQQPTYGYPTPSYGYPNTGWQQQQQLSPQAQALYAAPGQVPGQTQAQFGTGPGQSAPSAAVVDPPGGVAGYNAPGAMAQGIRGAPAGLVYGRASPRRSVASTFPSIRSRRPWKGVSIFARSWWKGW